jgi:tetratricopeptide (TPR) repeat protein
VSESVLIRLWNAVKPPPSVKGRGKPMTKQRRKQRLMILFVLAAIASAAAGWGVYGYVSSAPQRAQKQFDTAEAFIGSGNYGKAVDGFTRALSTWPQMAEAYVERGLARHRLGEDDQALADLDRALQIDPNLSIAYAAQGAISRDRGNVSRAIEEYTKSIQARPNVDAYFERAQLYERLSQHQNAIADYDQAIAYLRDAPHVYRARAFAKANMGDEKGAQADREIARSLEHH